MNYKNMLYPLVTVFLAFISCSTARSQEIPDFTGGGESSVAQSIPVANGLKFFVALDDAPFSFIDDSSKLSGFSVFLARAVCEELNYLNNCTISGRVSQDFQNEAIIQERAIIISNSFDMSFVKETYRLSSPFLRIPGRFMMRRDSAANAIFEEGLAGIRLGALANSAEERMARAFFPDARITGYADKGLLMDELKSGKIGAVFADGLFLANWLSSDETEQCCRFAGGPYYSAHFLGYGPRFAVPSEDAYLVPQIDAALKSLQKKGKIEELFLRFFPVNFF